MGSEGINGGIAPGLHGASGGGATGSGAQLTPNVRGGVKAISLAPNNP